MSSIGKPLVVNCEVFGFSEPAVAVWGGAGVGYVPLGVVPTPFAGAHERSLNSLSRYHALRVVLPQGHVHA
ncbi:MULTISPECIES: hypothetical protein [unclassified Halomonas]|uniref:hypothetical protein n=1 Tax=unclassified Halomonas TaxID=2609666 RepID=UPI00047FCF48|nr:MULTISPECIES: hypothetical protein [unclassified Halomonas]